MAQLFEDEKKYPDNQTRRNFVFLGYPFAPPLPKDDYKAVIKELEEEFPLRLWYFLDEVTTHEMMRKIWRAILRADLAFFDISGGNPNVAFELGLSVATNVPCITLLKTGEPNPLGGADLSYSERVEYTSRETLKSQIRNLLKAKASALRDLNKVSYSIQSDAFPYNREEIENRLKKTVSQIYRAKKITKATVKKNFGDDRLAALVLNGLRQENILKLEGQRKAAKWSFSDKWVYHDHEVVGS